MKESEQYTITEPELQLYNEGNDENYSLPSFASIAAHSNALNKPRNKPSPMDDTSSTMCGSTDESSMTSNEPLVKIVVDQCYRQFRASESFEVEYSLTEYESKLYLEDMKNRLDEPIVEELGDNSDDDDFDNDSILSLNTLEKDEFDEFIAEHSKAAPQYGCLGLIQMGITACREEEEEMNEFYANDDAHLMRTQTDESSFYDEDVSCGPSEPLGEKFVTNEISFTKDSSTNNNTNVVTGIDLTEAKPVLVSSNVEGEENDDEEEEEDKPTEPVEVPETESVSSNWGPGDQGDDEQDNCTTSVYLGTYRQDPLAGTDSSLVLDSELYLDEDDSHAGSTKLEPDGIKMRSHKDGKFEIQGFALESNGLRNNAEELEVLHLEPADNICEA